MTDDFDWPDYSLQFRELMGFLARASDREAAIVASAYCEDWITAVLQSRLPNLDETLKGRLFAVGRPLGNADARYDLAAAIGAISSHLYNDIKRLAIIRNRFAHAISVASMEHPRVAGQIDNLESAKGIPENSDVKATGRRGVFNQNALHICMKIHNAVNDVRRSNSGPQ